jgi:hypothetical protein
VRDAAAHVPQQSSELSSEIDLLPGSFDDPPETSRRDGTIGVDPGFRRKRPDLSNALLLAPRTLMADEFLDLFAALDVSRRVPKAPRDAFGPGGRREKPDSNGRVLNCGRSRV